MTAEFEVKLQRIQALLERNHLDALLLQRVNNFAWATCGASSYIDRSESAGEASLLITTSNRHLITSNVEAARLRQEEKLELHWEFKTTPWYDQDETIAALTRGLKLGSDGCWQGAPDLSADLTRLRTNLTTEEIGRFRKLGSLCAEAMDAAVQLIRPGQSEHQIAAFLEFETERRGLQATVVLVGTDERISAFRHPLPTGKELKHYAMLVLCARKWGLVCSMTRLVHFGRIPDDLQHRAECVARIDAEFISATRPGARLGDIFERGARTYAESGFPEEWQLHHQGGLAGYRPREVLAVPGSMEIVSAGQVFAWNPSITGTKSEDSILVGEDHNEVLTGMPGWPVLPIQVKTEIIPRPAILEVL